MPVQSGHGRTVERADVQPDLSAAGPAGRTRGPGPDPPRAVRPLRGQVLEIGAGNGLDLPHYPSGVTELVRSEPGPSTRRVLRAELQARPPAVGSWEITDNGGEQLPFPDASFDAVSAPTCSAPCLTRIARSTKSTGFCAQAVPTCSWNTCGRRIARSACGCRSVRTDAPRLQRRVPPGPEHRKHAAPLAAQRRSSAALLDAAGLSARASDHPRHREPLTHASLRARDAVRNCCARPTS